MVTRDRRCIPSALKNHHFGKNQNDIPNLVVGYRNSSWPRTAPILAVAMITTTARKIARIQLTLLFLSLMGAASYYTCSLCSLFRDV